MYPENVNEDAVNVDVSNSEIHAVDSRLSTPRSFNDEEETESEELCCIRPWLRVAVFMTCWFGTLPAGLIMMGVAGYSSTDKTPQSRQFGETMTSQPTPCWLQMLEQSETACPSGTGYQYQAMPAQCGNVLVTADTQCAADHHHHDVCYVDAECERLIFQEWSKVEDAYHQKALSDAGVILIVIGSLFGCCFYLSL